MKLHPAVARDLSYNVLYPGFVGSMVFDLFDPLRFKDVGLLPESEFDCYFLGLRFLVLMIFVTDYLHLRWVIRVRLPKEKSRPKWDLAIAAFFVFGYFMLSRASGLESKVKAPEEVIRFASEFTILSTSFILVAFLLVFFYTDTFSIPDRLYNGARWCGAGFSGFAFAFSCMAYGNRGFMPWVTFWLTCTAVAYAAVLSLIRYDSIEAHVKQLDRP